MIQAKHFGVRIEVLPLFHSKIIVKHMGLFHSTCNFYRETPTSQPNYQFFLDSISSKRPSKGAKIEFSAHSFICRDLNIKYDILNQIQTKKLFNTAHIHLKNVDGNFRLNSLSKNNLNIRIRDLRFNEDCGLNVQRSSLILISQGSNFHVKNLEMTLPHSSLFVPHAAWSMDRSQINICYAKMEANFSPSDFSCFYSPLNSTKLGIYHLKLSAKKIGSYINIKSYISDQTKNSFSLITNSLFNQQIFNHGTLSFTSQIKDFNISSNTLKSILDIVKCSEKFNKDLLALGNIKHSGTVSVSNKKIQISGQTKTDIGAMREQISINGNFIDGRLDLNNLNLGKIFPKTLLSTYKTVSTGENLCNGHLTTKGNLYPLNLNFTSQFNQLYINNYNYKNIIVSGTLNKEQLCTSLTVNDKNITLSAKGKINLTNNLYGSSISAHIIHIKPQALNLTNQYGDAIASADISLNYSAPANPEGSNLEIKNFKMSDNKHMFSCDTFQLSLKNYNKNEHLNLNSDFLDAHLSGNVSIDKFPNVILTFLSRPFPALHRYLSFTEVKDKDVNFRLKLKNSLFLSYFFHIPLELKKTAYMSGYFDNKAQRINLTTWIPQFLYNGEHYTEGSLYLNGTSDSLQLLAQVSKMFDQTNVKIVLNSMISNNQIFPHIEWESLNTNGSKGTIQAMCFFFGNEEKDKIANIHLYPSEFSIKDTLWNINSSDIALAKSGILLTPLELRRGSQYISITNSEKSEVQSPYLISLNDIEIAHIQDLLNFHPVDFSGKLTGKVLIPVSGKDRDIPAHLTSNNFHFNNGDMGFLDLQALWDAKQKQLHLDALTQRTKDDSTYINGVVKIGDNAIDLHFHSHKTNIEFLNHWLSSVLGPIQGTATGNLRLFGPLNGMNLEGDEQINSFSFHPPVNNVEYHIINDSLHIRPGKFIFDNVAILDSHGGKGNIKGIVTHNKIHNFAYDLNFQANNMLSYNWNGMYQNLFWGTVFADGNARLWGNTSNVHADLNLIPTQGTTFYYDTSDNKSTTASDFIRFHKGNNAKTISVSSDTTTPSIDRDLRDSTTNIYLTINTDVNSNARLVVYTDRKSGDGLSLRGNGHINASWFNKGKFNLGGLYTTEGGEYRLTIKDLLHRTFEIQPGGTIRFSGGADDGDLDLKGIYQVHSVSLSDLNLGGNMSTAMTNVNCILNFGGKSGNPQVTFGLEFPTAGDDLEQTLHSAISSQEDLNMQMLYLLTVGRFYTYDYASTASSTAQNQSVLAMQSLFAGTLGNRLGSFLTQALHINNWTFGPNIAAGRLGWEDMEVGGQLSGSLLSHRLLLSGNFGYREQNTYTNNFVGDFNLRWLLNKRGTVSFKAYSETNDRYFSRSSLSTQGGGLLVQKDFNHLSQIFKSSKSQKELTIKKHRSQKKLKK